MTKDDRDIKNEMILMKKMKILLNYCISIFVLRQICSALNMFCDNQNWPHAW